jgi:hypothetical protein
MEKVFKIHVDVNLQIFFSSIYICIYIVGSLVVLERGVRVRRNCNIFNLAMENVFKRLT